MRYAFVIDENVFIFAHTLKNEREEDDLSSAQLILAIMDNCHRLILSPRLFAKYSSRADTLTVQDAVVSDTPVIPLIMEAEFSTKVRFLSDDLPQVTREKEVPDDDIPIVRLAATARAIIATTDDRLRKRLNDRGISAENGFDVMRPEGALEFARTIP